MPRVETLTCNLNGFVVKPRVAGGDEAFEERMRLARLALKFRMELARDKERMIRQLDHFHQFAIRRSAAENKTRLLELLPVNIVEFITVPVAFVDQERSIE